MSDTYTQGYKLATVKKYVFLDKSQNKYVFFNIYLVYLDSFLILGETEQKYF